MAEKIIGFSVVRFCHPLFVQAPFVTFHQTLTQIRVRFWNTFEVLGGVWWGLNVDIINTFKTDF